MLISAALVMLALCVQPNAWAAPVAEAVPDPKGGAFQLGVRADVGMQAVEEIGCEVDACLGSWHSSMLRGRARLAPLKGLSVFGEAGWGTTRIKEADYRGDGLSWAGGLNVALPLWHTGWWVASQGRAGLTEGVGARLDEGGNEHATLQEASASLLAAWGTSADEVSTWLGIQTDWWWNHNVFPLGGTEGDTALHLNLGSLYPVSAVAGAALASQDIGRRWASPFHLVLGVEARVGSEMGFSTWLNTQF